MSQDTEPSPLHEALRRAQAELDRKARERATIERVNQLNHALITRTGEYHELANAHHQLIGDYSALQGYARDLEARIGAQDAHIGWLEGLLRRVEDDRLMALSRLVRRSGRILPPPVAPVAVGPPPAPAAPASPSPPPIAEPPTYLRWIAAHEPDAAALAEQRRAGERLAYQPLISVITPVFNPPPEVLRAAIESVQAQSYPHWQLCLADGGSTRPGVRAVLEQATAADPRIRLSLLGYNGGISANSNAALALATGEFVLIFDHDDLLAPDALFQLAQTLNARPDADVVYFDEDKISADGATRHSPWFKPAGRSPALLLATNYLMHSLFRRTLVNELGGFDHRADGAQDWDLALRCFERTDRMAHIPRVLYHWRQLPGSAAADANAKPWALVGQVHSLRGHLARSGAPAARLAVLGPGQLRVLWPTTAALVSIIIPSRDKVELLRACLGSIFAHTNYANYEIIIVDTGSREQATLEYYAELRADLRLRIIDCPGPFNYSRANNLGAAQAKGELLLFLNNDTEAIGPDWLDELVGWGLRPEVGIVGAKLIRPDGSLQHAGIAMGLEGHGSHLFDGDMEPSYGPFGSSEWYRDLMAVTGACMLMRRAVFEQLGGLDERYEVGFSDIALCLAAVAAGLRVVYTPYARLLHHEGGTRGFTLPPADVLRATMQMLPIIARGDPFYSPNLSPTSRRPAIAEPGGETIAERLAFILRAFGVLEGDSLGRMREELDAAGQGDKETRRQGDKEATGFDEDHSISESLPVSRSPRLPVSRSTAHVLLTSHELSMSGAPLLLFALARHLTAHGYRVTIASSEHGPLEQAIRAAGIELVVLPGLYVDGPQAYRLACAADLVLANTITAMRVVHAARAAGTACLWWVHESAYGQSVADTMPIAASAFAAADGLVFPTRACAALYTAHLGGAPPVPIYYGIAPPPQVAAPPIARAGRLAVVAIASIEPRKGQDVLLKALAALSPATRERIDLYLVGKVVDWPFYQWLSAEATALGNIFFSGEIGHSAALGYLQAADIFVLPSRDEVLPISLLEALACAKPIIVSAVGGVPETIVDGRDALCFASEDYTALAAQLERLADDPALREGLGQAARTCYERQFTLARFLGEMEARVVGLLSGTLSHSRVERPGVKVI